MPLKNNDDLIDSKYDYMEKMRRVKDYSDKNLNENNFDEDLDAVEYVN